MKYIEDFKEGDFISGHYFCSYKQNLKSKVGKSYISLKLQDKTGVIDGKVWEINNNIKNFEEKNFIKVESIVTSYQNNLQLKINKIRQSEEGEYDKKDFIPCTEKDVSSLYENLLEIIKTINNKYIKQLLENIFIHNEEIVKNIKTHSAAKQMHHNYMGGLIEHLISVVQICEFLSQKYKYVNRDILITGALLHDIGKIYELLPFPENDYSDDGELLGHIIIGVELLTLESSKIEKFPHDILSLLKHCIIGHHGELEFGSPKKPKTIEAFIIHCVDNMDAKTKVFEDTIQKNNTKGNWLGYNKILGINIRKSEFI